MLLDGNGMPLPEATDFASPSAIVDFAMAADERLSEAGSKLDLLEQPPCIIGSLSAPYGPHPYGDYEQLVNFDTLDIANRGGDISSGIWFGYNPGIWHVGVTVNLQLAGAISSFKLILRMDDSRGPRLENSVTEEVEVTTIYTGVGPCALNVSSMFEIHQPNRAYANAFVKVISGGAGNFTVAAGSTNIWAYRVRGLTNV